MYDATDTVIGILGLGYVGLPLAVEFGRTYPVIGFDINARRIAELTNGIDRTGETTTEALQSARGLTFSTDPEDLRRCTVFIITVPTPVDEHKRPNLVPLLKASETVGSVLKKGDIVVYESTVYPGCTEEDCVPVLEQVSGLRFNVDFYGGYSPERINPGDKVQTLTKIKKVVSGSTPEVGQTLKALYGSIIEAGIHLAPSIKVAEASKAIENAQRDVNISFVNELAIMFDIMGIDTTDVLEAASTKWNFLPFKPGLVGGHCIGVDPYYLMHKARTLGYNPQVLLSGRYINENMGMFVANKVVKLMVGKEMPVKGARALLLGITFKENCPDIRNTRVVDIYRELVQFGISVDVYDPWADPAEVAEEYDIQLVPEPTGLYEVIILAVSHQQFRTLEVSHYRNGRAVIFDTKSFLDRERHLVDARL
ncbi:Vi polysaccharide biosynthesis UDP-N-acetylglucosamine C-6 dehydrogenase TviB [Nibrella viscosa]|uniref:Vi polysaccharide biosynthesis UDP-N-acetylglucosamine C-6 dehydrogenase TviB n=1 Tax=Nibrella viscosa TaxID=1084524 RepID=A0ABP8K518_9BACT